MTDKSDIGHKTTQGHTGRFGIGEWFGMLATNLSADQRKQFLNLLRAPLSERPPCPFQSSNELVVPCNKAGGVCSMRLYQRSAPGGTVQTNVKAGRLRTMCPKRFEQDSLVYRWISETILGSTTPKIIGEIGFLEKVSNREDDIGDDVGRIDKVLVLPRARPLAWCAVEVQAVYFSGDAMTKEWNAIKEYTGSGIPFPSGRRRPDYRSSGPKRLMPQLQIKVPSLRRWGKKMAVVVDEDFWEALGPMDDVGHMSNCDIAWFIVAYNESSGQARLEPANVRFTTLERAVEGLTAGRPVSLDVFEGRILSKLPR